MSSNNNPPSSLPPLDSNLAMLFKGFIVTLSPLVGWVALKLILFIINHPQYFILTWLTALVIGLVAEFFKEARRPPHLSRLRPNANKQRGRENSTESSSNTKREQPVVANQKIDSISPTTVLFKSTTRPDSENNVPDGEDDDAEESDPTTVQVETRVKMSKKSRSRSSTKTSSGKNKGFGKPVIVRMNYQMDQEDSSSKQAQPTNNPTDGIKNMARSSQKARGNMNNMSGEKKDMPGNSQKPYSGVNLNTNHNMECMFSPSPKIPSNANTTSPIKETTRPSQNAPVDSYARLEQSITRTLIADESNSNNNCNSTNQAKASKERNLFGKLDNTNGGDSINVELALEADEISDDDVQQDVDVEDW